MSGSRRGEAEVEAYSELMLAELAENDHKPGWVGMTVYELVALLKEECGELLDEISGYAPSQTPSRMGIPPEKRKRIASEGADIGNAVMFVLDNFGCLGHPASPGLDYKRMLTIMVHRYQRFGHPIMDLDEIEARDLALYVERTGDGKGLILKAIGPE